MIEIKYMQNSYWLIDTNYPETRVQHPTKADALRGAYIYLNILGHTDDQASEIITNLKIKGK